MPESLLPQSCLPDLMHDASNSLEQEGIPSGQPDLIEEDVVARPIRGPVGEEQWR